MREVYRAFRRFIADERGQTMVEWAIVASFLVMALAVVFGAFPAVIARHYARVVSYLLLPVF